MKKSILIFGVALTIIVMQSISQNANAQAGAVYAANANESYDQASTLVKKVAKDFHLNWTKVKWAFGGMDHIWWYVKYENGTQVWNNFRDYRTAQNVLDYFTGKTEGDCDAVIFNRRGQVERHLCYNSKQLIKQYKNKLGTIIDIGFKDQKGKISSLMDFQKTSSPARKNTVQINNAKF